jgi:hypothetical protein
LDPDDLLTFQALQRLEQGKMQALGDELLPYIYTDLRGLTPRGKSLEGKTTKGVPDSMVGKAPATCLAAVEYTTQATGLQGKFDTDYAGVRLACPKAQRIYVCTNRDSSEKDDFSGLLARAKNDGVTLTVVLGPALARVLARDRQDLRLQYLGIPIGAHTRASLMADMQRRLDLAIPTGMHDALSRHAIPRAISDRALHALLSGERTPVVLVTAPAGFGKSVWSARHARARARSQPVMWSPANQLRLALADPISLRAVQMAYGTPQADRATDLKALLVRERLRLLIVLDAIEEVHDFSALGAALRDFKTSALGERAQVVLMCREEALPGFSAELELLQDRSAPGSKSSHVRLEPISRWDTDNFLLGEGGAPAEVRVAEQLVPHELRGRPFFLKAALSLAKAGATVKSGQDVIAAFAAYAVAEISKRLKRHGAGPSDASVVAALVALASHAVTTADETIPRTVASAVLGTGIEGEQTVLGRALHVGLLEERPGAAVAFSHALYLEYFAAQVFGGATFEWPREWPPLSSPAGARLALRLARYVPSPEPMIRSLLGSDAILACECAVRTPVSLSAQCGADLANAAGAALANHLPSVQRDAIRLLASLRVVAARQSAVAWFNALSPAAKIEWSLEAADLFLRHELIEAAHVILWHRGLFPQMAWYEPSFVAELDACSEPFRIRLRDWAWSRIADADLVEDARLRLVNLLTLLRDSRVVPYLRARFDAGHVLTEVECRALIFVDTEEAIAIYGEFTDRERARPLDQYSGATEGERNTQRHYHLDALVLLTTDIRMYPHDRLVELTEAALGSDNIEHIIFGLKWARFLCDPRLITAYMDAKRRHRTRGYLDIGPQMVDDLMKTVDAATARRLYEEHSDVETQAAIVRSMYLIPGVDTEDFLIERVERREHVADALQSLRRLRAMRAGVLAHEVYRTCADKWMRYQAIKTLGTLKYNAAEAELCDAPSERNEGDRARRRSGVLACHGVG